MVDNDDGTPVSENSGVNVPMYKFMIKSGDEDIADTSFSPKQVVNEHWQLIHEDGRDYTQYREEQKEYVYVYAYAEGTTPTLMERNDITNPLFDKVLLWNFNENFDAEKDHNIRVEALGIQSDIDANDINSVWALLEEEVDGE